jgi:hypothetical protein
MPVTLVSVTNLDERYGRKPANSRRNLLITASVLFAVLVGWLVTVNFFTPANQQRITGDAVKLHDASTNEISATIEIVGNGAKGVATCVGKALDAAYGTVGYKQFSVALHGTHSTQVELVLNTTRAAGSVVVESCSLK